LSTLRIKVIHIFSTIFRGKPNSCSSNNYTFSQYRAAKGFQAFSPAVFCQAAKSFNTITSAGITIANGSHFKAVIKTTLQTQKQEALSDSYVAKKITKIFLPQGDFQQSIIQPLSTFPNNLIPSWRRDSHRADKP